MNGFEGVGDFDSADPWQRYIAHQAAKGNYPRPPVTHQQRVAAQFPKSSVEHLVALYHDHLEDGLGEVPAAILHHVDVLTRRAGEGYADYVRRVRASGDRVAIAVKVADARDNLARCEGRFGGDANPVRARRYRWVLKELA